MVALDALGSRLPVKLIAIQCELRIKHFAVGRQEFAISKFATGGPQR